jgi:predicted GNAT family acetyltransferase
VNVEDRPDPESKNEGSLVFEVDGYPGELQYRVHNGKLILKHTEVADELRGRGLGAALVESALDKAAEAGLTVWPWCEYARAWLQKHPEEAKVVTIDWADPPR